MPDPLQLIMEERARQDEKWGEQNHDPFVWLAILGEEYGEACKTAYEGEEHHLRVELVHVAAVAVAMLECGDRQGWWSDA